MINLAETYKIKVQHPTIKPKISTIGYGNPRYNSMVVYKEGVLVSVGSHLRWVDIKNNKVLFDSQIGCCQIFQIMQNNSFVMVINFDGLISLLSKDKLEIIHQFYGPGKQIRHSAITNSTGNNYIAISCELNQGTEQSILAIYHLSDIQKGNYKPFELIKGYFYYPQYFLDELVILQYNDPNPKGRKRKDTVLSQKLPITNRIIKFNKSFERSFSYDIQEQGQIICAVQNQGVIYYLHNNKKLTVYNIKQGKCGQMLLQTKSYPHLVEKFKEGIIFANGSNVLSYLKYDFEGKSSVVQQISIKSLAIGGNVSLKFSQNGIYSLNENGFHFYCNSENKTYTQSLFSITNCGISLNSQGDLVAVADFGGTLHIFNTNQPSLLPDPLFSIFIGIPIRCIAWCQSTNNIVIGCVGGSLFWWRFGQAEADIILQIDHTFNILRAVDSKIYAGTSDGQVMIFDSNTMILLSQFKAHHPIQYTTEQQKQLFGSMKNYSQIWSLTLSPNKEQMYIVSSSEDQTEKVFKTNQQNSNFDLQHHLKGHQLAVTSIDWKIMNEKVGQIYVSCSDDKIIRFRDPKDHFKVLFEVQTSTIKQWHTLTYLALEPNGHRVAVGSQNGYLFIYDIENKQLQFGEKIHLGGIQGLDWVKNKLCTCSSDLCVSIFEF